MQLDYKSLKERQRAERDQHPEGLALRVHRALSWLDRAEQCEDDDGRFIFLWIAFNAAYSNDLGDQERPQERELFEWFLGKLIELDSEKVLATLMWTEFPGSIRVLLENQYVYQPFWDYHNGKIPEETWISGFEKANDAARRALGKQDSQKVLGIVLSRMYTLRNQLIHGGATWNSGVNRDQLRDCAALLGKLVPQVIKLMLDNPGATWGEAYYPVVAT